MPSTPQNEAIVIYPSDDFVKKATISGRPAYQALCQKASADYENYWANLAREHISWKSPFTEILDESTAPFYKWFADGKLNVSYNCLDRHVEAGLRDKVAFISESDDGEIRHMTYRVLLAKVCQLANALRAKGIGKGDRVIIYMSMSIEAVIAMQTYMHIGAIHSVVFAGFSARSIRDRIEDAGAVCVITQNGQERGGRCLPLKLAVDEAIELGGCETVKTVIVNRHSGQACQMFAPRDIWWEDFIFEQPSECEPEWVDAEHPLFLLYTSGSTGKPKGAQHASAGFLLHAIVTMKWTFDLKADDTFWCTADVGWITGHTYVAYGPLACGGTQVLFEGIPTYPGAGRFWRLIQNHKVSIFYTAPTAIRSLIKATDVDPLVGPHNYNLSTLRLLGSVGELISPETWLWYYNKVGGARCPIVDTFWQTETGGHVITPIPGATPMVPGSCTLPFPGIDARIVDETGAELEWGKGGLLVIAKPWPSMIRTIWNDPERFKRSYFPEDFQGKLYLAGDGAIRDKETGYFTITGRIDDMLNVSGHRMGTREIESALASHPKVAEAAAVGKPDELTGEAICAFVVLKGKRPEGEEAKRMIRELQNHVAQEIGPIAKPRDIRFGDNLPKTRSGKIMRRLLRSLAIGDITGQDISTLENPAILAQLKGN